MKKFLIFFILTVLFFPAISQNEIYLARKDTVIKFYKIKIKKAELKYTVKKKDRRYKSMLTDEVDYVKMYGNIYGVSDKYFLKIDKKFFENDTSKHAAIDACKHYNMYKKAAKGTFWTSFVAGPAFGLIPAIIITKKSPLEINLNMPDNSYKNSKLYQETYKLQAKRIKNSKVWESYGNGLLMDLELASAVIALSYFGLYLATTAF
ncbi:MAG: hypothetical protein M0R21_08430 [Lentimicrobiaceae bacterium]|jgi:hypothetical protein|nr:hypothetical protein [Lentimicrobiaceae bacterium]